MLRLASLLLLLNLSSALWANNFEKCHNDVKQSYKFSQNHHMYKTAYGWLLFSKTSLSDYLRCEPLLGLYLLNDGQKAKALKVLKRHPKDVAAITNFTLEKNRIVNEGLGLDRLALLKYPSYEGTAVFGACCTIRGFVTDQSVVTSEYLLRFLKDKKPFTTAGIHIENIRSKIVVTSANPFFTSNPFKKGDEIIRMDGKKRSLESLTHAILFAKVGSKHTFMLKRAGKNLNVKLFMKERLGGGVLGDTYIEQYGFRLNKNLETVFVDKNSFAFTMSLKKGDILRSINNHKVSSDASVRDFFQKPLKKEKLRFLFERKGLQFSIFAPSNIMLTLHK